MKELGTYAGGAVYAAVSQDAAWALVCYDHTSHLFRLGDAITEVSAPGDQRAFRNGLLL